MFLGEASWRRELVGLFETGCRGVGKFETLLLFFVFFCCWQEEDGLRGQNTIVQVLHL